ncbi:NAD(P)-dependent oxidoreductase [Helcobacillus massiliensis]|uniref:NAD(P)-dependent oxidoreductase n=1 Tax=Helcobacillus massiliensis TaxID=521392 RepID=UPI0025562D8B|nr:NAD(P)-dependent oxidoreductase [Helcobacillus massiliensis]MDK7741300.1 NAD(P)-dependent oxidoreductase [Helcobacillus massiliensis]WOO92848.1 NAD(P)-dependent oxidoreductase [Helcobacillus massiliensis]
MSSDFTTSPSHPTDQTADATVPASDAAPVAAPTGGDALNVGWIGLGAMGGPMARVTAKAGHRVTAFDMNPASLEAVAPDVAAAPSARDAAAGADAVVIMVATGPQLMSVLFGETGIAEVLTRDTVVMVMATVGPAAIEEAAAKLAPHTARFVDAPVSGGVARAGLGDLLVMVSGADGDVAAARPLLDAMASNAPVVGSKVGDGQRFKVVNQLLCGVHIAAAGEALALADSMGLDVAQVHEVLGAGAAQSFMFGDRGSRMVAGAFDDVRSALDIFVKDMGLVNEAAGLVGQEAPLAGAAQALYQRGHDEGMGRLDDSVVFRLLGGGTRGTRGDGASPSA